MGLGSSSAEDVSSSIGRVFTVRGRFYRILETIGQGSEATVYRCEDQNAAQYAVKVFYFSRFPPSDLPRRVERFTKEGRILKYLGKRSRHFIHLVSYQYRRDENVGYMIMELGEGSLRQYMQGTPMPESDRRMYWKQLVTILKVLEDARVVHADIKPDNLILVNNVLKVTDLGIAFRLDGNRQSVQRPMIRGTLDYMAPEIFAHETGFKSDVWSAGIILYEMTYGRPPYYYIADRSQKVSALASTTPIRIPALRDRALFDCIRQCLQTDFLSRPNAYQIRAHPYSRM